MRCNSLSELQNSQTPLAVQVGACGCAATTTQQYASPAGLELQLHSPCQGQQRAAIFSLS